MILPRSLPRYSSKSATPDIATGVAAELIVPRVRTDQAAGCATKTFVSGAVITTEVSSSRHGIVSMSNFSNRGLLL